MLRSIIRFVGEVFRLAFKAESWSAKVIKWGPIVGPMVSSYFFEPWLGIQVVSPSFSLPIQFVLGLLALLLFIACSFAITWAKIPRLKFVNEMMVCGDDINHYRVHVENSSLLGDATNCRVAIKRSYPRITHLPIYLHCSGEHHCSGNEQPTWVVNLRPEEGRTWDVLRINKSTEEWEPNAAAPVQRDPIKKINYLLTLVAIADNCKSVTQDIVLAPRPDGTVEFRVADWWERRKFIRERGESVQASK